MDFIRGAALSRGGKPIWRSGPRGRREDIRIVPELNPGAGVVTPGARALGDHGIRRGQPARNDAARKGIALISIAHPDFRAELARAFTAIRHFPVPGLG